MSLRSMSIEELHELTIEGGGEWCGGAEVVVWGGGLVCITIHWR